MRPLLTTTLACLVLTVLFAVGRLQSGVVGAVLPSRVSLALNILHKDAVDRALIAYQLVDPTFDKTATTLISGSAAGEAAITSGAYDFVVSTGILPPSAAAATTATLAYYPFMVSAYAPFYNLPAVHGTTQLVVTMLAACQIWRGNITRWNDPRLASTNPKLNLPDVAIEVVMNSFANDGNLACARMCTRIDPVWASTKGLGITSLPTGLKYTPIPVTASSPGGGSYILDTPYTFGWNSLTVTTVVTQSQIAAMINQAGKTVEPTPATVQQTFLELAANGIPPGQTSFELVNPQSAYAWPVCVSTWLLIDAARAQTTCVSKKKVLNFLLWLYTSPVASTIAASFKVNTLPLPYVQDSNLLGTLRRELLCNGAPLIAGDTSSAFLLGTPLASLFTNVMTTLYTSVDNTYQYTFTPTADALALERVTAGEVDCALVQPALLTAEDTRQFMVPYAARRSDGTIEQTPGGMIFPAALSGLVFVYTLPAAIVSLYGQWSVLNPLGGLPQLYPLRMDIGTLAAIFSGEVASWMDNRVLALNPQLAPWFVRTGAPTTLKTIVCCTAGSTDAQVASNLLLTTLYAHNKTSMMSQYTSPLAAWTSVIKLPTPTMSVIESEGRMQTKAITSPGSVTYRLINSVASPLTSEFRIVVTNSHGDVDAVAPTPDALGKCITTQAASQVPAWVSDPQLLSSSLTSAQTLFTPPPGCYPLVALTSVAIASSYTSTFDARAASSSCTRGQKVLQLLAWMQRSNVLSKALNSIGLYKIADAPVFADYIINNQLNAATCDGKTILIVLPLIYEVSHAVTAFAIATSSIVFAVCLVTLVALWSYRRHPVVRASSSLFLALLCVGFICLAAGLIAWAQPISTESCATFQWLANLGFTLAFAPLFARTWRIYAIFSAKKMKVVKIPNSRLVWAVIGMLAFEVTLLSIWTGVSPLQPITYERPSNQEDGAIRLLTHCSVDRAGMAFVGIEAAFKGALVFFGALMSFSTRKVASTFNESSSIAWAIYNLVFSSIIVTCIIVFVDTLGDTLLLLIAFLLLWIIGCTWAFLFVPKITAIFSKDSADELATLNITSSAHGSISGASFSFASILAMPVNHLAAYVRALEMQLERARTRYYKLGGKAENLHSHKQVQPATVTAAGAGAAWPNQGESKCEDVELSPENGGASVVEGSRPSRLHVRTESYGNQQAAGGVAPTSPYSSAALISPPLPSGVPPHSPVSLTSQTVVLPMTETVRTSQAQKPSSRASPMQGVRRM